jgi:tetratricopeptide (TPR) repeat protein
MNAAQLSSSAALSPESSSFSRARLGPIGSIRSVRYWPNALRPLQSAALSEPNYFPAHYNLGNAFASLGRLPEAIHEFQIAAHLDPSDSIAETNWAALAETGELSAAREQLKKSCAARFEKLARPAESRGSRTPPLLGKEPVSLVAPRELPHGHFQREAQKSG